MAIIHENTVLPGTILFSDAAGELVIEPLTSKRTIPFENLSGLEHILLQNAVVIAVPKYSFNGYVEAARMENDGSGPKITIELSKIVAQPTVIEYLVVGRN